MNRTWRLTIAAATAWLLIACSAVTPPSPVPSFSTPPNAASSPSQIPVEDPSPDAVPTLGTPCEADITLSGDYSGTATGRVTSDVRRIGDGDAGVSVDTWLDIPQGGTPTQFMFSVFDTDGPGPKPVLALFSEFGNYDAGRAWEGDQDPHSGTLANDGTSATFDMEFARLGNGPTFGVEGTLTCDAGPTT